MTYFISDIHGEYDLLIQLLYKIKFSSSDRLIVLGDMIDKGNNSIKVLQQIYSLDNAYCILGNHEYDFLKYYRAQMNDAVSDFELVLSRLQNYFPDKGSFLTWELLDWLDGLPAYISQNEFLGVHAGVSLDKNGKFLPLCDCMTEHFVYDRDFKEPYTYINEEKVVIYGHTPTSYLNSTGEIIKYLGKNGQKYSRIHIDTGVYLTGMLGCYAFESDRAVYVKK